MASLGVWFSGTWNWGGLFPGCLIALDHRGLGRALSQVPESTRPQGIANLGRAVSPGA